MKDNILRSRTKLTMFVTGSDGNSPVNNTLVVERAQYINLIYFTSKEGRNSRKQNVEKLFNLSIDILSRQQNVNYLQDYDHFLKRKNYFLDLMFSK